MWELLLIANHLDQSLFIFRQSINNGELQSVRSYLLHSSLAGVQLCCNSYQAQLEHICCRSKTIFPELNRHILTFLRLILICRVTYGGALEGMLLVIGLHIYIVFQATPKGIEGNTLVYPSLKPSEGLKERSLRLHKVQVIEMNV